MSQPDKVGHPVTLPGGVEPFGLAPSTFVLRGVDAVGLGHDIAEVSGAVERRRRRANGVAYGVVGRQNGIQVHAARA